jgi:hypothetical protein
MRVGRIAPALAVVCLFASASPARSEIITIDTFSSGGFGSFAGAFTNDNDVALIGFLVGETSLFTASTNSFAAGNFDPMLSLLDAAGNWITDNNDSDPEVPIYDAALTWTLAPGAYTLVLTQAFNYVGLGLAAGFDFDDVYDEAGNLVEDNSRYTVTLFTGFDCQAGFANLTFDETNPCLGSQFSGQFDLTPEQPASVPEPGTLALVALGLGVASLKRRRAG